MSCGSLNVTRQSGILQGTKSEIVAPHLHLQIGHRHALIVNPIPERNIQEPGQLISVATQSGQISVINQIEASTTTIDQIEFIALVEISVSQMRKPLRSKCS